MITRRMAVSCVCAGAMTAASGAVRGDDVRYVGGTIVEIPQDTEGSLLINPDKGLLFECKKGSFEIPFGRVTSLEYGQKAGRRLGVAIMVNPVFLLSKKRKHYITIGYKDGKDVSQGVVLELAKSLPAKVITIVEARSGVKCDYESEEARKHLHG